MTRSELISQLKNLPCTQEKAPFQHSMIELLENHERCFYRDCFPGHFTGSALVLSENFTHVLLTHHKFLNKWLQFGGHCDGEENIFQAALREAQEESGIMDLTPLSEMPFDIDVHAIPANPKRNEPAHFHYDVRYVFTAPQDSVLKISDESHALQWFPIEKASSLNPDLSRMIEKIHFYIKTVSF